MLLSPFNSFLITGTVLTIGLESERVLGKLKPSEALSFFIEVPVAMFNTRGNNEACGISKENRGLSGDKGRVGRAKHVRLCRTPRCSYLETYQMLHMTDEPSIARAMVKLCPLSYPITTTDLTISLWLNDPYHYPSLKGALAENRDHCDDSL